MGTPTRTEEAGVYLQAAAIDMVEAVGLLLLLLLL